MTQPSKPRGAEETNGPAPRGSIDRLLALIEKWRAQPLGDEDEAVAELDRALREDPVRFHDLGFFRGGRGERRMSLVLDTSVLGRLCHPSASVSAPVLDRLARVRGERRNASVYLPEIADFEVRRELLRLARSAGSAEKSARATEALERLDDLCEELFYLAIDTPAMKLAAELWAEVRRRGMPTADDVTLDADVILAAQTLRIRGTVATVNVRHFERFDGVAVQNWK